MSKILDNLHIYGSGGSTSSFQVDNTFSINGDGIVEFGSNSTVRFNSSVIFNDPLQIVNKSYVDSLAVGLDPKESVHVTATSSINIYSPPLLIDGVTMSNGERVLLWMQSGDSNGATANGIYIWNGTGSSMTRSLDMDGTPVNEVSVGNYVLVTSGLTYKGKGFVVIQNGTYSGNLVPDVNIIQWVQFSANDIIYGNGLSQTGSQIDVKTGNGLTFSLGSLVIDNSVLTTSGGTINYLPKFLGINSLTSSLIYDNGTNIGIGTNNPGTKLHIDGGNVSNTLLLVKSTGVDSGIIIDSGEYPIFAMRSSGQQSFAMQGIGSGTIIFRVTSDIQWRDYTNNSIFGMIGLNGIGSSTYFRHNVVFDPGLSGILPSAAVHIKGYDSLNTNYAFKVDNSSNTSLLYLRNDNMFRLGDGQNFSRYVIFNGDLAGDTFFKVNYNSTSSFSYNSELVINGLNGNNGYNMSLTSIAAKSQNLLRGSSGKRLSFASTSNADMQLSTNGDLYIGLDGVSGIDASARLHIKGSGSTPSNYSLKIDDSTNSSLLYIRNDGQAKFGVGFTILSGGNVASVTGDFPIYSGYGGTFEAISIGLTSDLSIGGSILFNNSGFSKIYSGGGYNISYKSVGYHYFEQGNIGVGTASPTTLLHIFSTQSGAFRLQDTTQGNGKILVSDSNGVASWTSSSSIFSYVTASLPQVLKAGNTTGTYSIYLSSGSKIYDSITSVNSLSLNDGSGGIFLGNDNGLFTSSWLYSGPQAGLENYSENGVMYHGTNNSGMYHYVSDSTYTPSAYLYMDNNETTIYHSGSPAFRRITIGTSSMQLYGNENHTGWANYSYTLISGYTYYARMNIVENDPSNISQTSYVLRTSIDNINVIFGVKTNNQVHIGNTSSGGTASFKYVDGNQGLGKVLISDANGIASWTSSSNITGTSSGVGSVNKYTSLGVSFVAGVTQSFTHSLGSKNIIVQTWDNGTGELIYGNVSGRTTNSVKILLSGSYTSVDVIILS